MSDFETPPPAPDSEPPAQAPPSYSSERPLLRRDHHKHLAGVAGGLADYLGIDAGIVRIAFVVLAFFGVGLPLYLVGWIAMPSPSMPQSYVERWFGRSPNPAALVGIAAVVIVLFALSDDHGGGGVAWGLVLLFGGWLLFRADSRTAVAGGAPVMGPPTPPTAHGTWYGPGGTAAATAPPVWVPPTPRPRSILGRLTVGVALASVGVAALLDQAGAVSLDPAQYVALAMAITGFGLVISAWAGRAYGLIGVGFLLLPVMLVLSIGPLPFNEGAGEVTYAPTSVATVAPSYELGAGELELDLGEVDFAGTTRTVAVSVGFGQTTIIVPDDVTVAADLEMRAGEIELFGVRQVGRPFLGPVTQTFEGQAGAGRLDLVVDNAVGELVIRRETQEF
jgi:phage shock protein PspC (stress-responsive transcriptional regulator)